MKVMDKPQFIETFACFDNDVVVEIIDIFINEYPERIEALTESINNVDYDNLKFNAHSIKGVVANFVAPLVEQQAKELEKMGAEKNMDGVKELFESFKLNSASLVEELIEIKEEFV